MNSIQRSLIATSVCLIVSLGHNAGAQKFRHVESAPRNENVKEKMSGGNPASRTKGFYENSLTEDRISQMVQSALTAAMETDVKPDSLNELKIRGPWVFSGYRHVRNPRKIEVTEYSINPGDWFMGGEEVELTEGVTEIPDPDSVSGPAEESSSDSSGKLMILQKNIVPDWLRKRIESDRVTDNIMYSLMVVNPGFIDYAYWDLPTPPQLPEDDVRFSTYLKNLEIPEVNTGNAILPEIEIKKRYWLHNFNTGLQFSQAYISQNWYQGGNNHLSLLFNFFWDVQLNTAYNPNLLFQSTLQYKLGLNSTNQDKFHKYSISEDIFQYNLKAGVKAFKRWFYSYTLQFKTQMLNNYEQDSQVRKASFLSPADLNMGLGMTYNYENQYSTIKFSASIAPISYNLKTCVDRNVDPTQFNILPGHKTVSKIGSSAECTLDWTMTSNISLRSRLFGFTDYSYFQGDLETTVSFAINRFLSTQIYAHLRYDSSSELTSSKWRHWMLKEILSFGLSYTFSTVP